MADTLGLGSNPLNRVGVQVPFSIVDNYVFMKISTINFFVALKNASVANKGIINIKANQEIIPILQCLYEQGFILSFNYVKSQKAHEPVRKTNEAKKLLLLFLKKKVV